jgi:hypothetical protein
MNHLPIPRGAGLEALIPARDRALLQLPDERVRIIGIGMVEKWAPDGLARKTDLEFDMVARGATPQEAATRALADLAKRGIVPTEIRLSRNILVNTGLTDYNNGLTTAGLATPYSNANANLGVGDSSTAAAVGQTDLQAASNKLRKAMDATYPTVSNGVATFRATFATSDANFAWQEWAVFNASSTGRMLNRAVSSLGTKTSAQSWQLTVTITLA